jgi:hypothetical protein
MSQYEKNKEDIEFILGEIQFFAGKSPEELKEHFKENRRDALYQLPHPGRRGYVICGREAFRRFSLIAKRYLSSQKDKASKIYLPEFVAALRTDFSQRFLGRAAELNKQNIERMLCSAYRRVSGKFDSLTHYIPCSIVMHSKPEKFQVGPVQFMHKSTFQKEYGQEIETKRQAISKKQQEQVKEAIAKGRIKPENAATLEQSERFSDQLADGLNTFFNLYDWVGIIKIEKCHPIISRQRAILGVEAAINILKLLLGQQHSDRMRTAFSPGFSLRTAELTKSSGGGLDIRLSWGSDGNVPGEDWFDAVSVTLGFYFTLAQKALVAFLDSGRKIPLCRRFVDALAWYGDAVSEPSPASKVVKYVSAMERMTVTGKEFDENGKERSIAEIVVRRAAMLCLHPGGNVIAVAKDIEKIYECRSDILHGSLSPFDESISNTAQAAETVARILLLSGLEIFGLKGLEDAKFTDTRLREYYLILEKEFLSAVSPKDAEQKAKLED